MIKLKAGSPEWEHLAFNVDGKVTRIGKEGLAFKTIPENLKPFIELYVANKWILLSNEDGPSPETETAASKKKGETK